jgi:hypothetical protein
MQNLTLQDFMGVGLNVNMQNLTLQDFKTEKRKTLQPRHSQKSTNYPLISTPHLTPHQGNINLKELTPNTDQLRP